MTLMECLRDATRHEHRRVELLPFASALATGALPLESYVAFLDAFRVVHSSLEQAMAACGQPLVRSIWDESWRLAPRLEQDVAYFKLRKIQKSLVISLRANLMAQRIRQRTEEDPLSLLGYLYVLLGATLGGAILKTQIAQTFALEGPDGLAYVSTHGDDAGSPWPHFRKQMNGLALGKSERQRIVDAANEAFTSIAQIVEALYPLEMSDSRVLAQTLNAEAGRHHVPLDEREIQAALQAGERSLARFPYYRLRYGARGERFTRSDSAWLVTLAAHEPAMIYKQMTWLGHVLSARGMPQWMLENHLEVLHESLVGAVPENTSTYDKLLRAAELLRMARRKHVSDDVMAACESSFRRAVGEEWSQKLPEAGMLLAGAVADEKQGVKLALSSVESWMVDAHRFPAHWIVAVHKTIQLARDHGGAACRDSAKKG